MPLFTYWMTYPWPAACAGCASGTGVDSNGWGVAEGADVEGWVGLGVRASVGVSVMVGEAVAVHSAPAIVQQAMAVAC